MYIYSAKWHNACRLGLSLLLSDAGVDIFNVSHLANRNAVELKAMNSNTHLYVIVDAHVS